MDARTAASETDQYRVSLRTLRGPRWSVCRGAWAASSASYAVRRGSSDERELNADPEEAALRTARATE